MKSVYSTNIEISQNIAESHYYTNLEKSSFLSRTSNSIYSDGTFKLFNSYANVGDFTNLIESDYIHHTESYITSKESDFSLSGSQFSYHSHDMNSSTKLLSSQSIVNTSQTFNPKLIINYDTNIIQEFINWFFIFW